MSKVKIVERSSPEDDRNISDFFSHHRHKNSRNVIAYTRQGTHIRAEVVNNGIKVDVVDFDISKQTGNDAFCQWAFEKLGIDFKGYKKRKDIEWQ